MFHIVKFRLQNCVHTHASRPTFDPSSAHNIPTHIALHPRRLDLHFLHSSSRIVARHARPLRQNTGLRVPYFFSPAHWTRCAIHDEPTLQFCIYSLFIYSSLFAFDLNRQRTYHHCTTRYACPFLLFLAKMLSVFQTRFLVTNCYEYSCTVYMIRPVRHALYDYPLSCYEYKNLAMPCRGEIHLRGRKEWAKRVGNARNSDGHQRPF
ncbi:hypothetical protein DFH06DRAFT_39711 [Mycena polygramma]|nr:hypothetical protein DFH06DRAFT_39711 [Mycena polygramma]